MGWFDKLVDVATSPFQKIGHDIFGVPTASENRAQKNLIDQQIASTKAATDMANEQMRSTKEKEALEKKRVQKKQIRGLQRRFKPSSFLDDGTGLPDKLGE